MRADQKRIIKLLFLVAIVAHVLVWMHVRHTQARWLNVPPVPSKAAASTFALGDRQFAYRTIGIMLQNLGDTGGRSTALDDYDAQALAQWFYLEDELDPRSHYVPFLAAYYYGAARDPKNLRPLIEYVKTIGHREGGERWRWLAHAVYIARWQMNDLDLALELAYELANLQHEDMPVWTRQMPAFILNAQGNKEEAEEVMMEILKSSADKIHPNEVNHMRDYICTRLLDVAEAAKNPLCHNIP